MSRIPVELYRVGERKPFFGGTWPAIPRVGELVDVPDTFVGVVVAVEWRVFADEINVVRVTLEPQP
jgi:hypothetical protein